MKNTIFGIVIGIFIAITCFLGYMLYSLSKVTNINSQQINSIISVLITKFPELKNK